MSTTFSRRAAVVAFFVLLLFSRLTPALASYPTGPYASFEGHLSLFTDERERSILANTFGYGMRVGYRWERWAAFLHVEHNLWTATEYDTDVVDGAVNIGLGADYAFADGLIRTSVAAGVSVLAFDTLIDDAGSVGIFLDARPLGLRWELASHVVVGLDPIAAAVVAPVLDGIPLVVVEYRSLVYVEGIL